MRVVLAVSNDAAISASLGEAMADRALVLHASCVDDALRRASTMHVDAFVVDDFFGSDGLTRLRAAAAHVPILYLGSRNSDSARNEAVMLGAKAYIPKPFTCEALDAAIEECAPSAATQPASNAMRPAHLAEGSAIPRYQTSLRWIGRMTGQMHDAQRLIQCMRDTLSDVFDAVTCAVLIDSDGSGKLRVAEHYALPDEIADGLCLDYASGLFRWFDTRMSVLDPDQPDAPAEAMRELAIMNGRLAAPIICRGRVCGAMVVGDMASGARYTADDRELLATIARCASSSLENARHYESVTDHRHELETILQSIPTGIAVVGPDRRLQSMNSGGEKAMGVAASEVRGLSVQKLGSGFADVVLRAMRDKKPRLRQIVQDAAAGVQMGVSATPLPGGGAIAVFQRLPEDEEAASDVLYSPFWEFLATRVAQEVKNPMVAINTFAQLLPRKYDSEDFRHTFSEVVQQEIARINGVVDTLNEFAHRPHLMLQRADLNETVRNVVKSFESELRAHAIEIEEDYASEALESELDPIYFSQALHNVVQNSIEAMPKGGKLKIETRRTSRNAEVKVTDTGHGIPDQDIANIFLPFFSSREKGMGLGLTLAGRIMRQHDGQLALEPTENGGSAFALRLPYGEDTDHAKDPRD